MPLPITSNPPSLDASLNLTTEENEVRELTSTARTQQQLTLARVSITQIDLSDNESYHSPSSHEFASSLSFADIEGFSPISPISCHNNSSDINGGTPSDEENDFASEESSLSDIATESHTTTLTTSTSPTQSATRPLSPMAALYYSTHRPRRRADRYEPYPTIRYSTSR